MDEELKKRLIESANGFLDWAQQGGAFVKEQAPLYVQELLAWEFASAAFCAGLSLLGIALCAYAIRRWGKFWWSVDPAGEIPLAFCTVVLVASSIGFFVNTYAAVKVKVAPRVVLVEKLRAAVR